MKIGILTHYYNSKNYGGLLQAYALATFLKSMGHDAEQICFDFKNNMRPFGNTNQIVRNVEEKKRHKQKFNIINSVLCRTRSFIKRTNDNFVEKQIRLYENKYISYRYSMFRTFEEQIPHSQEVYNNESIHGCLAYDCFIVGSDQVWNFNWYSSAFFLEFVPKSKKKISYASSAGKENFTEEEVSYLQTILSDYNGISVREKSLLDKLSCITPKNIVQVLDPVFLLPKEDWETVATERLVSKRYIFCYFLSTNENKELIKKYARKHGLEIVMIPFCNEYSRNIQDLFYPDIRVNLAGPNEFVSLIKNADMVFTDSFHAVAFSLIFKKEFFAFERSDSTSMTSRIASVCNMFNCSDRLCNGKEPSISYFENKHNTYDYTDFESMKNASIQFLKDCLE